MYFECNIPMSPPAYMDTNGHVYAVWAGMAKRIHDRFDKLNRALMMSNMRGEDFAEVIRPYFMSRNENGDSLLDSMDVVQLAVTASNLGIGKAPAPSRCEWPNCNVVVDTAFVSTQEWEIIRCLGLGGSDSANVINEGYRTARDVFMDKVGTPCPRIPNDPGQALIFDVGHAVEPVVINEFCRRFDARVIPETRMFSHKDYPYLIADVDGILCLPDEDGGERLCLFEAKTTTRYNRDSWSGGAVPRQYVPQCRKYMAVLNDPRIIDCYIGCLYGNLPSDYEYRRIIRDLSEESDLIARETAFWTDHILAGNMPPLSRNADKDKEVLLRQFGQGKATGEIELDREDYADACRLYMESKKRQKELKEALEKEQLRATNLVTNLMEKMGSEPIGFVACPLDDAPDIEKEYVYKIKYSTSTRKGVDIEKLRELYPKAYAATATEGTQTRRFSMSLIKKPKDK